MTEFSLLQEVAQRHRQGGVAVSLGLSSQSKVDVTKRSATPDNNANLIIMQTLSFSYPESHLLSPPTSSGTETRQRADTNTLQHFTDTISLSLSY